jgi:hypothetical protein
MPDPKKASSPLASLGGIISAVGGWLLSDYAGTSLWIPGISALLLFVLFTRTSVKPKEFAGAIAAACGHVVWFVVGAAVVGAWSPVLLDIVVMTIGVLWLWARPALRVALILGLFELAALVSNCVSLISANVGSAEHKALAVHCVFRLLVLSALVVGFLRMKRQGPGLER